MATFYTSIYRAVSIVSYEFNFNYELNYLESLAVAPEYNTFIIYKANYKFYNPRSSLSLANAVSKPTFVILSFSYLVCFTITKIL